MGSVIEIFSHTKTPYYLLSLNFGIFFDDQTKRTFTSLDSFLGYHMLLKREDRDRVFFAPNGFIAYRNTVDVFDRASKTGEEVIVPSWHSICEDVLRRGVSMKMTQCLAIQRLLLSTSRDSILDHSRREDRVLCTGADNLGLNLHGKILEEVRERLRSERKELTGHDLPSTVGPRR